MSLPHFFAGAPDPGQSVTLDPADARHAVRSLRLRPGDRFTSGDGAGAVATCRIVRADLDAVEGHVDERRTVERGAPLVRVLLAPPKGERLSWAVQKLTEVGADEIVLLEAPRSVRRWQGERAERAASKLETVAREAAKQSRRPFLPSVAGPMPWSDAFDPEAGPRFVLWEEATEGLLELLPEETPEHLTLVIGPEGGILEDDARAAERSGARLVSLGPHILRTETAAVAAAVVSLARYGRLG